jgi:hypothetical protein
MKDVVLNAGSFRVLRFHYNRTRFPAPRSRRKPPTILALVAGKNAVSPPKTSIYLVFGDF